MFTAAAMTLILITANPQGDPVVADGATYTDDSSFAETDIIGEIGCCLGPMPQTCYSPRYGCYPGNGRCMHRYPAFHGAYYRRPYNYRNLFDYPWHAQLHEPTSLFSYGVPAEDEVRATDQAPPPPRQSKARDPMRSVMKRPRMMNVSR